MKKIGYILISGLLLSAYTGSAKENGTSRNTQPAPRVAGCFPGSTKTDLAVNNVRAKIFTSGDMWWDLVGNAQYEVPKGSGKTSLFAGSLWIGGIDAGGQLKVAAMTYRQTGNDFWPGPLANTPTSLAEITPDQCNKWDKHFTVSLREVQDFYNFTQDPNSVPGFTVPNSILTWPGNGDVSLGQMQFLAPFTDVNGDGNYDPSVGDYPAYDLKGAGCDGKDRIYGDQTMWWVFNDKGDIHTESGAEPLGLEIHAQAFGFITNDEINSMTFYKYKIFNRSNTRLNDTYFAMWVDPDLGDYGDDLIGCDVKRGLGFCYNFDDADGSGNTYTYGANPPAIGVDFFEGPFADKDGVDNPLTETKNGLGYGNGIADDERLGMEKFMFYKNDASLEGNPDNATHFYNYLSGRWKDGIPITYGGTGHSVSGGTVTDYMFPWDTDDDNGNVFWEQAAFSDGRMVESAGTFSLEPGAVNTVTVGAVWARATTGGRKASVELMRQADDKAQKLFENCFQLLKTPDAPDLTIKELDKELIILIGNKKTSNNFNELFSVVDPLIPAQYAPNNKYVFEGYKIYQVVDASVTATELEDPDRARLILQSDVKNGVGRIINYEFDANLGVTIPKEMVAGSDAGIVHSFRVTEDQFALGDKNLVNHKTYHFLAVAYAYNNFKGYKQDTPPDASCPTCPATDGQKLPFLGSSKNIVVKSGIPHIPAPQAGGTIAHSKYGDGVKLTRIEGQGNGGNVLDFDDNVHADILASNLNLSEDVRYQRGKGPVNIKVVDPLNVPEGDFEFRMVDTNSAAGYVQLSKATWTITNKTTGQVVTSDRSIDMSNEQIITDWGLAVTLTQVPEVFCTSADQNILEASLTFKDESKAFLVGLPDADGTDPMNWIRSGTNNTDPKDYDEFTACTNVKEYIDPDQEFEKMLTGWAPYRLTSTDNDGPAWNHAVTMSQNKMSNIASVDIVFTPDQSKWSRCVVFETGSDPILAQGGAAKLNLRKSPSVDKDGNPDNSGTNGMGWFPGYAINLETGERLNIAFGESSWLQGANGADMMYNPTEELNDPLNTTQVWGGKHYIYVFGHNGDGRFDSIMSPPPNPASPFLAPTVGLQGKRRQIPKYDSCQTIYNLMKEYETVTPSNANIKRAVFTDAIWTGIMGVDNEFKFKNPKDMPTEATVRIRIAKPYKPWAYGAEIGRGGSLTVGKSYIVKAGPIRHNNKNYQVGQSFVARNTTFTKVSNYQTWWAVSETNENGGLPMYTFNSADIAADTANADAAKNALALINVVPNPYYAYSGYETTNLDNVVKFTNLPQQCTISIYTANGTLVRRLQKDDPKTSLDWDIKNTAGVPIASGVYIVHVKVDGVGERILKWFGMIRPVDLDVY